MFLLMYKFPAGGMQRQFKSMLAFLLIGYKCIREASVDLCFSKANDFVQCTCASLKTHVDGKLSDFVQCTRVTLWQKHRDCLCSPFLLC